MEKYNEYWNSNAFQFNEMNETESSFYFFNEKNKWEFWACRLLHGIVKHCIKFDEENIKIS